MLKNLSTFASEKALIIFLVHICGIRNFTAEETNEKLIEALPYPDNYGSSYLYCWYTIIAPDHKVIRFWVEDFGTEQFYSYYYYIRVRFDYIANKFTR